MGVTLDTAGGQIVICDSQYSSNVNEKRGGALTSSAGIGGVLYVGTGVKDFPVNRQAARVR